MLYCPKCRAAAPEGVCPLCGSEDLREAAEGDMIFLLERSAEEAEEAASLLKSKELWFEEERAGEKTRLYVPYESLEAASACLGGSFKMSPKKRAFWKAFSLILFLLLISAVVLGTDSILNFIKSLFA